MIRRFATLVEFLVTKDQDSLKVDLALDSPFRFEPPVPTEEGIWVNDYVDLCVDKLLAYYGRTEPRDAVDLLLCSATKGRLVHCWSKQRRRTLALTSIGLRSLLNRAADFPDELEKWPVKMLVPFEPATMKRSFQALAVEIMQRVRGE